MPRRSGCNPPQCADKCLAAGASVAPVQLREEKFISANDVVSTTITSSRPVTLQLRGNSFDGSDGSGQVVALNGVCTHDAAHNAIRVQEGGKVKAMVKQAPNVLVDAKLMLDGMSAVLSASRPLTNVSIASVSHGVCGYSFDVLVDERGTTVSWGMDDQYAHALAAVQTVLANPAKQLAAKTAAVNGVLNDVVPYFRCSYHDIVKIYYYLWSLYLMLFTEGDRGMQLRPRFL